jgi:predicted dehydrogenase
MTQAVTSVEPFRPLRLGFAGTGWIGRHRMQCLLQSGLAEATAIAEPSSEMAALSLDLAPGAELADSFEALLDLDLDGIVIATPSAMHAAQSIAALERGIAVFCQKPLGRNGSEVEAVIAAARNADRLLGVDLSYRHTAGMAAIRKLVRSGRLGEVFLADLTFHNAYGPDKPWFYDKAQSGGGCLVDLGVHLVDLALFVLDFPPVRQVESNLFSGGRPLTDSRQVEDCAIAAISLESGATVRIACSWRLHAGHDAVISAGFFGTEGGVEMSNVAGSFFDFETRQYNGTSSQIICSPPEDWGGRAVTDWARRLADGERFDPRCERYGDVARVLDAVYEAAPGGSRPRSKAGISALWNAGRG